MDLSKAFDSIPHDLLIAKMHAYGFSIDAVTFFYSYLKRRKENVKISNTHYTIHSVFQILLSEVPQGVNAEYVKEIFYETTNLTHRPFDIKVDTTKYGNKSLRSFGPHIWSSLPKQIKEETDYNKFKNYIDKWFGAKCKCNLCSHLN